MNAFALDLSVCNLHSKPPITCASAVSPSSPTRFSLRSRSLRVVGFAVRAEAKAAAPFSVIPQHANLQKEFFTSSKCGLSMKTSYEYCCINARIGNQFQIPCYTMANKHGHSGLHSPAHHLTGTFKLTWLLIMYNCFPTHNVSSLQTTWCKVSVSVFLSCHTKHLHSLPSLVFFFYNLLSLHYRHLADTLI